MSAPTMATDARTGGEGTAIHWALLRDRLRAGRLSGPPPKMDDDSFARRYLKGVYFPERGNNRWFEPTPLHAELSALADRHARLLVHVSRDFAKSTRFSLIRPLRMVCEDRDVRILVISKTERIAGAAIHRETGTQGDSYLRVAPRSCQADAWIGSVSV